MFERAVETRNIDRRLVISATRFRNWSTPFASSPRRAADQTRADLKTTQVGAANNESTGSTTTEQLLEESTMDSNELRARVDAVAPDGSDVRLLVMSSGASMAHFTLAPGATSVAIAHRTLEEMWYFVGGLGEMWRRYERTREEVTVPVHVGVALTIPDHTHFQFRSFGDEPLAAVGVTLPPWPGIGDMDGTGEVYFVHGPWEATVPTGVGTRPNVGA
jgi:mannose-6-phosphate isomerase-like protein (cupin superfamily)